MTIDVEKELNQHAITNKFGFRFTVQTMPNDMVLVRPIGGLPHGNDWHEELEIPNPANREELYASLLKEIGKCAYIGYTIEDRVYLRLKALREESEHMDIESLLDNERFKKSAWDALRGTFVREVFWIRTEDDVTGESITSRLNGRAPTNQLGMEFHVDFLPWWSKLERCLITQTCNLVTVRVTGTCCEKFEFYTDPLITYANVWNKFGDAVSKYLDNFVPGAKTLTEQPETFEIWKEMVEAEYNKRDQLQKLLMALRELSRETEMKKTIEKEEV